MHVNIFRVRENELDSSKEKNIEEIKEFEITGVSKYIKNTTNIDTSSSKINSLSEQRNPVFESKTVFLKVIISGKASLYKYSAPDLRRYFYSLNQGEITPLVYKKYL